MCAFKLILLSSLFLFPLTASNAENLKLGLIIPLSGPAAGMGDSLRGVSQLAEPKHLVVSIEDDQCSGRSALSAYLKLKNEGVKVFYLACSGSILAVAPHAKRNGDLILTTYAGSSRIRETGGEVIRLNPDALSIADGVAKQVRAEHLPAVILHEEQEYASSLADRLTQLLGKDVSGRVAYRPESESYTAETLKIKSLKPRSIILVPVADGAARNILKQLSNQGVKVPVYGEVNLCDYPFKPSDYGFKGSCVTPNIATPVFAQFIKQFSEQLGYPPAYPYYNAMALDLFHKLDELAAKGVKMPELAIELLRGFAGKFATYKFTPAGEAEPVGEYLEVREY